MSFLPARPAAVLALCLLCAACGGKPAHGAPETPQASTKPLIASRGAVMTLADAVKTVRFVPFIPSAEIVGVAAIPPLSDARGKRAPGMAIEYERGGNALLLSQWPREGLHISVGAEDATNRPCAPVAYQAGGLLWTTRNGRVMTLQPDGTVAPSRVAHEAARLLRAGACGGRVKTLSRPLPAPSPVVSSPRRSAS